MDENTKIMMLDVVGKKKASIIKNELAYIIPSSRQNAQSKWFAILLRQWFDGAIEEFVFFNQSNFDTSEEATSAASEILETIKKDKDEINAKRV